MTVLFPTSALPARHTALHGSHSPPSIRSAHAGVAELADARDLGSRGRKAVQVRFLSPALVACVACRVPRGPSRQAADPVSAFAPAGRNTREPTTGAKRDWKNRRYFGSCVNFRPTTDSALCISAMTDSAVTSMCACV